MVSSFSKYWGMPGWRLGWMLMPDDLAAAVDGLAGSVALCPPAAAQEAAVHAFSEESYAFCAEQAGGFTATRGVVLAALPRLGWADAAPADGAFYLWARLAPGMLAEFGSAVGYCAALLEEAGVALTPATTSTPSTGPSPSGSPSPPARTPSTRRSSGSPPGMRRAAWPDGLRRAPHRPTPQPPSR